MISHFVEYQLARDGRTGKITDNELKGVAQRLCQAIESLGYKVGDMFGAAAETWGFSVETEDWEILVDVTSPDILPEAKNGCWCTQLMLRDPGWLEATRVRRIEELRRLEWSVHKVLGEQMGATGLVWFLGDGPLRIQIGETTP